MRVMVTMDVMGLAHTCIDQDHYCWATYLPARSQQ